MSCEAENAGVLVLAPHTPSRLIVLHCLSRIGLHASDAGTFADAKTLLRRDVFAAVSIQCPLPDAAFTEVMNWLRETPRCGKRIYVLAITSMPEVFSRNLLLREGADDYLVKPVTPDDTCQALRRMQAALISYDGRES